MLHAQDDGKDMNNYIYRSLDRTSAAGSLADRRDPRRLRWP